MLIKLLTSVAGRDAETGRVFTYEAGQVVEWDDEAAARMILKGRAEPVNAPAKPSKAKAKPKTEEPLDEAED